MREQQPDQDEPVVGAAGSGRSRGTVALPRERRRSGRQDAANPQLIPLLRRSAGGKACGACRDGAAIFPFTIAFQPVVDLQESRIDAYEALVRGEHGEGAAHVLGQVTPDNRYAFDQACRVKAIELAARLGIARQLNINFLPNAVYEPRACIQTTLRTAARTGFPLDRLTFEIVESEGIADTPHLLGIIAEYRRHGFRVALDDFGTGHSGLARLVELRPDIVKLDRVLVEGCDADRTRLAVVAGLLRIGTEIGVKMVLEGVETAAEVAALAAVGGRYMQGYFFARPAFEHAPTEAEIRWPAAA
ncbi:EAL domain-containing protein [Paracraurococcus ruber]|uniref:EAL domain-containing protein n=1 Tax=Paracraurococcus ruber TaxID=77675 RepID=UPI0030845590